MKRVVVFIIWKANPSPFQIILSEADALDLVKRYKQAKGAGVVDAALDGKLLDDTGEMYYLIDISAIASIYIRGHDDLVRQQQLLEQKQGKQPQSSYTSIWGGGSGVN